jgi:hypothetical protein
MIRRHPVVTDGCPRLFAPHLSLPTRKRLGRLGCRHTRGPPRPSPHPDLVVSVPAISALTDGDGVTDHAINKGLAAGRSGRSPLTSA